MFECFCYVVLFFVFDGDPVRPLLVGEGEGAAVTVIVSLFVADDLPDLVTETTEVLGFFFEGEGEGGFVFR